MKQMNKAIGIIVVLVLLATAASASVQPKLTLTTDKSLYNWNDVPQVIISNAGSTNLNIVSATLQIKDGSGVSVYYQQIDIGRLKPKMNYIVRLNQLLPAGSYKAVLVYSLAGSMTRYTISSNVFVVAAPLILKTEVYGSVQGVKFSVTNPGTQPIDLSSVKMQVYTAAGVPLYDPFSVYPSYYPLQPNTSYGFTWGVFGGIPAGTYRAKMTMQTSNGILVIDGDLFTVK